MDLEQTEKGRKNLEKLSLKIKTTLEAKETELEEKIMRLATVEKKEASLSKEVERLQDTAVKAKELERENKELQKQATIDKRTLATLREVKKKNSPKTYLKNYYFTFYIKSCYCIRIYV